MSEAEVIKELVTKLTDEITFTDEACEDLTQVPKLFRKMALKTLIKAAKKEGLSEVDKAFALKFKP